MKKSFTLLFSLTLFTLTVAMAQVGVKETEAEKVLQAMSDKYKGYGSFKADFAYSMKSPASGIDETNTGTITVKGEKYVLNLGGQTIINDGSTVHTYLKEANEVNISDYEPEQDEISPTQIYTIWKEGFKYSIVDETTINGKKFQVVDLVPEDKTNNFFKIRLTIAKDTHQLKSWKIFEKNGNRYLYEIKSFEPNFPVTDKTFTFQKSEHPGVEIVDLR